MCELTHGMAWARHAMYESDFRVPSRENDSTSAIQNVPRISWSPEHLFVRIHTNTPPIPIPSTLIQFIRIHCNFNYCPPYSKKANVVTARITFSLLNSGYKTYGEIITQRYKTISEAILFEE